MISLKDASKKQSAAITLTTNENATATLTLSLDKATAKKLKLSRTVGTVKAALAPGKATISVKLSAKARKAFKKLKRVKLIPHRGGRRRRRQSRSTKTVTVTLKK